jgi:hypothetical protein
MATNALGSASITCGGEKESVLCANGFKSEQ